MFEFLVHDIGVRSSGNLDLSLEVVVVRVSFAFVWSLILGVILLCLIWLITLGETQC